MKTFKVLPHRVWRIAQSAVSKCVARKQVAEFILDARLGPMDENRSGRTGGEGHNPDQNHRQSLHARQVPERALQVSEGSGSNPRNENGPQERDTKETELQRVK